MGVASTPPAPAVEQLQQQLADTNAQLATANARIADLTAQKAQSDADEKEVAEKMQRGLTREQALAIIRRQRQYDQSDVAKAHMAYNAEAKKRKAQKK